MSNLSFTNSYETIRSEVKKYLASYGKRRKDSNGKTLFADITTSTAENAELDTFIKKGADIFVGETKPFVAAVSYGDSSFSIWFSLNHISTLKQNTFGMNAKDFIVQYTLMKVLELSGATNERKEAEEDLQRHLDAAIKIAYTPDPPTQDNGEVVGMTGEVDLNEDKTDAEKEAEKEKTEDKTE